MTKVFLLKDISRLNWATQKILKDFYSQKTNLTVKIHFGEPGNTAAFTPEDIKPVTEALDPLSFTFLDTPVAYPSPRNTARGYEMVAKRKGFSALGKIKISNNYLKVKAKDFVAEVSQELIQAGNVLVLSHVKGHPCSGFGGAIKNLGMGGVSKKTKIVEHDLCKPVFVKECQGCGTCLDSCPSGAIKMINKITKLFAKKTVINQRACLGCSICEIVCPYHCLEPKKALFDDLLAQGAAAVINNLPKKTYYINFLKKIVKNCDCYSRPGETLSKDIGILFSQNPVAIDKASIDLINKINDKNLFKEVLHKDPLLQINSTEKYTKWRKEYKLIEI